MARMLYGAGAYAGSNPIGGGPGYQDSDFREGLAHCHVESAAELVSALKSYAGDKLIWLARDITCPSASALGTLKARLGASWGTKIKQPYKAGSFMTPVLWMSGGSVICGPHLTGPGGLAGTSGPRNCALRGVSGAHRIEVAGVEIDNFAEGGIYFNGGGIAYNDDSARHWIHHAWIHHIQKHGFGYGISEEGSSSYLVEACKLEHCRHLLMGQAGGTGSYEARFNLFGHADYRVGGDGAWYINHQVDWHGSAYSCAYSLIHHNTFSANNANEAGKALSSHANVGVRGPAKYWLKCYNNWTKKTRDGKPGLFSETKANPAFTPLAGGGRYTSATPAAYRMQVYDNWYGPTAPAGEDGTGGGGTDDGAGGGGTDDGTGTNSDVKAFGTAFAAGLMLFMAIKSE